jgi:dsRNA-specific ribonuclease
VAVLLDGEELARGRGASKKEAEQEAAAAAIEGLSPPRGAKE